MTNRERRNERRSRERVVAVGTGIDPEFRVLAYRKSLTVRPLDFVQREIRRLYRDAAQCDRKLFAFLDKLGFGYVIRFRGNIHVTDAEVGHVEIEPAVDDVLVIPRVLRSRSAVKHRLHCSVHDLQG
jgi:hypothetical protein